MSSMPLISVTKDNGAEVIIPAVTADDPKETDNASMETGLELGKVIELDVPRPGEKNADMLTVYPLNISVPASRNLVQRIYVVRKIKPVQVISKSSDGDDSTPVTQLASIEEVCLITKGENDVETIINEAQKAMDAKILNERMGNENDSMNNMGKAEKEMVTTMDTSTLTNNYYVVESVDEAPQRLKKKIHQECPMCNRSFRNLNSHLLTHKKEKKYKCSSCDKAFVHQSNMKRHLKTHFGIKAFVCNICNKSFFQSGHLKYHLKTHTGEKLFSCQVCEQSFSRASILKTHMRCHTGEKPYKCSTCNKTFASCSNMRDHEVVHTGKKPFACSVCPKRFCRPCQLRDHHVLKHSGEKPFVCMCGKKFPMKRSLLMHTMRVHDPKTVGEEYKCKICCKILSTACSLKQHIKVHSGIRPYSCDMCPKTFNQKAHLARHVESHHESKKQFQCDMCLKGFSQADALQKHLMSKHLSSEKDGKTVAKENPKKIFSCGECSKAFIKPRGLYKHMCVHLGDRPFQCGECGCCYAQAEKLLHHIREHS